MLISACCFARKLCEDFSEASKHAGKRPSTFEHTYLAGALVLFNQAGAYLLAKYLKSHHLSHYSGMSSLSCHPKGRSYHSGYFH
jgi:hypothetical protein